jgi:predicted transcriptional regulator
MTVLFFIIWKTSRKTENLCTIIVHAEVFIQLHWFISVDKSRTELVALILQAAIEGATAKRMLNVIFPSNMQLKKYLVLLQENGLLDYRLDEQIYITTSKGIHFLRIYIELNEVVAMSVSKENTRSFHITFLTRTRSLGYLMYYIQYISGTLRSLIQRAVN